MHINKIQRLLRKAFKDYELTGNIDEDTVIAFLSVDIVREENTPDSQPTPRRRGNGETPKDI